MCGIAGILNFKGEGVSAELLQQMVEMIRHRGPDASGVYTAGQVGLGHARLSIIDLSGGQQPMPNGVRCTPLSRPFFGQNKFGLGVSLDLFARSQLKTSLSSMVDRRRWSVAQCLMESLLVVKHKVAC
jgi:hypothetical protein